MSIVIERNQWEPELRYYVRSTSGATPICEIALKGDHWEVLFYRGATHPGPHVYFDFEKAKRHVLKYIEPREAELEGPLASWALHGQRHTDRSVTTKAHGADARSTDMGNPITDGNPWVGKRKSRRARRRSPL